MTMREEGNRIGSRSRGAPRVSRRVVLSAGVAAAAAAAIPPAKATAGPAADAVHSRRRALSAPRGTLRLGFEDQGRWSLDPSSPDRLSAVLNALYNRLVRHDEQGLPAPELAVAWEANPVADAWTFTLREGVTFHDGRPLTSQDVAYTLRHILDPEVGSPGAAVLEIVAADRLETPDDRTIVVRLAQPHADFPLLMLHYAAYIIPDGSGATVGQTGIGTGPFRLEELTVGNGVSLVANDRYWGGTPALAQIRGIGIAEADARVNALLADQVDILYDFNPAAAEVVGQNPDYIVREFPSGGWIALVMRTDRAPFDDARVRQAMKLVVDRPAMLQAVLQGRGAVGGDHPIWSGDPYALPVDRPRDIERARELLTEAGYADGLDVTLFSSDVRAIYPAMAVVYQQQAAEAGINVEIRQAPADSYWDTTYMKEAFFCSNWAERPADQILNEAFRTGSTWNESFWSNAEFDRLLEDARREADFEARRELYRQAQRLIVEEGGVIVPSFNSVLTAMHRRVRNLPEMLRNPFWDYAAISIAAE